MFGLSTKERLQSLMKQQYINLSTLYQEAVIQLARESGEDSEAELQERFLSARKNYTDTAANSIINMTRSVSAKASLRFDVIALNPALCGHDIDVDCDLWGGSLYALCFNAITGKVADTKDCIAMNHFVTEVMNDALKKADEILSGNEVEM